MEVIGHQRAVVPVLVQFLGVGLRLAVAQEPLQAGVVERLSRVSTGGGASLALLAGAVLPGVESLSDREYDGWL